MDRPTTRKEADARGSRLGPDEDLILPSRRSALDLCRSAQSDTTPGGPVLVTGDAGVGKTWLWKRLEAESPTGRRWVAVDITPSDEPADFYRLIAHELGLVDPGKCPPTMSRVGLVDFLAGRQADGERVSLVVEEAHNLSSDIWEEVRVLANRLGRTGGFASMILIGQTSLALRFATRPFAAIEARLASRAHLGPIGVDEAAELLKRLRSGRDWSDDEVEILHRDASGNPRRLLRLAGAAGLRMDDPAIIEDRSEPRIAMAIVHSVDDLKPVEESPVDREVPAQIASPMPLTGPAKPPIRVEENMIEVGWAPEDAGALGDRDDDSTPKSGVSATSESGEEAVRDHYAALQAWREWSENQARRVPLSAEVVEDDPEDEIEMDEDDEPMTTPLPRADRPTVRAEGEQKFAPFGHLFSKMAQALEPE